MSGIWTLLDHLPTGCCLLDPEGRILRWNATLASWTGKDSPEVTGASISDGLPELVAWGAGTQRMELSAPTGERRTVRLDWIPIEPIGEDGAAVWLHLQEETAADRAREQRSRDHQRLASIIESTGDAIIGYSPEGKIESWNPGAEELLGYTSEEIVGQSLTKLAPHQTAKEMVELLWLTLQGQTCSDLEATWERRDGERLELSLTLSPIRMDDGEIVGSAVIARDITQRKRNEEELMVYAMEVEDHRQRVEEQAQCLVDQSELLARARDEALQASRAKADFLSTMSHEIRTPMNGVIGMTEVLLDTDLDEEQLDAVQTIRSSGETLLALINDILDLSKIESGRLSFETVPFDLLEGAREVVTMMRRSALAKGIALDVEFLAGAPVYVEGDPCRIRQVLINLVGNAIKFTTEGGVRVRVGSEPREGEVPLTVIEVEDTGIGIAEDKLDLIFEAFSQADSSTTRQFGGTGLGLSICTRICEALGGRITVSSVPGAGSTFRVELPLPPCEAPAATQEARERIDLGRSLRVLLVEDNKINQKVALSALGKLGCDTRVVENGREAVEMLESERFDIVLMDILMPVLNGIDATTEIRERGLAEGTPIVAMTASVMAEDRERCFASGMDDYLVKPFRREQLEALLLEWCGGEAGERAA